MALASDLFLTADTTKVQVGGPDVFTPGWPCNVLGATPPSVADKQSNPTPEDVLPAVLALTPRGPAWGTDEAGDGRGAAPIMRRFWRGIAAFVADLNARDFAVAEQCFPSAVTTALPDWEAELGLPDPCLRAQGSVESRLAAVRVRFGAVGGASPGYLRCLAASAGYDIDIEEPTQFLCEASEVVGGVTDLWFVPDAGVLDGEGVDERFFHVDDGACDDAPLEAWDWDPNGTVWKFWTATVRSLGETWFRPDEGEIGADPLEGFLTADDLECLLRRACPPHTQLVFRYLPAA